MRTLYWSKSFTVPGVPTALKVGNPGVFTGTPTLGSTVYCVASCVIGSRRGPGMTLPGNGRPVSGSITSTHLREAGLAWQIGEPVGNKPVPALSSARLPFNCAAEGYRPVELEETRCRKAS